MDERPDGFVREGFEQVRHAFEENFAHRDELGAAYAVTVGGKCVVDLWGGLADQTGGRPWEQDSLQVIFSGTKALVAVCLLMLADRGALELEAPVAQYWPEFGQGGKSHIRVVEVASHSARLPGIAAALSHDDFLDDKRLADLLAGQPPECDSRAADVYHPFTYGWLCGELVRRVDGRSIGTFFAEEVAQPLGLELWIGLPAELEDRVTVLSCHREWGSRLGWTESSLDDDELLGRVWNNPAPFPAERLPWNRPDWHRAEIPGAGAIGTARSMARLCGCLAGGGALEGVRLLSEETLSRGRIERVRRTEPLLGEPQAFGVGFQLQTPLMPFGPPADAFGHGGAGGSIHCAWPTEGVGISYAMNLMRDDQQVDPRAQALLSATWEALREEGGRQAR